VDGIPVKMEIDDWTIHRLIQVMVRMLLLRQYQESTFQYQQNILLSCSMNLTWSTNMLSLVSLDIIQIPIQEILMVK